MKPLLITTINWVAWARSASVVILMIVGFLYLGAACSLKLSSAKAAGLFKSTDKGESWSPKTLLNNAKGGKSRLADIDVISLAVDPRNSNYVYMGTTDNGLYASENAGESWSVLISQNRILATSFDLSSRCVLYALTPKQLYKTSDCATHWTIILNETRPEVRLTSMVANTLSPHILYVTTSSGDIFQSKDRGVSWSPLYRFRDSSLRKIIADRYNPNSFIVATDTGDIYRTRDQGLQWERISDSMKAHYREGIRYRNLIALTREESLLFGSDNGLFRSINGGKTWEKLTLLTRKEETTIFAVAVNPENDSEIFYTTRDTMYRTSDAGKTWQVSPLPPYRAGSVIAIDPNNTAHIYLGLRALKEKSPYFYSREEEF